MPEDNPDALPLTPDLLLEQGTQAEPVDESLKIARPFDSEKIKVKTVGRTIDLIMRRIGHGEIDLAPDFQRRARIWKPVTKSQLIESLLLRIPLPVFYVAANEKDDWAVVDRRRQWPPTKKLIHTPVGTNRAG